MFDVIKKLLGLQSDPDASASLEFSWPAFRKSVRDALIAGAATAALLLLKQAEATDWATTQWAWVWQAAMSTGALAAVRRYLVDYSGGGQ